MTTKLCESCGSQFEAASARHRFCSAKCRAKAWRRAPTKPGTRRTTDNADALEVMLDGFVVPSSMTALVTAARSLAREVDRAPDSAGLWGQYRASLAALAPLIAAEEDGACDAEIADIRALTKWGSLIGL